MSKLIDDTSVYSSLNPSLAHIISDVLHWRELRPVQEKAFLSIRRGNDTLIMAGTAGGKSEAALLPVFDYLLSHHPALPVLLYVAPVKALINDIASRFELFLAPLHMQVAVWHGDRHDGWPLSDGDSPAVLCTTPESLQILLNGSKRLWPSVARFCIIDEVHLLAGTSRGHQLMAGLEKLEKNSDIDSFHITRIGLSATVGNPDNVLNWLSGRNEKKEIVREEPISKSHEFRFLYGGDKELFRQVTALAMGKRVLLFCPGRKRAEELSVLLKPALSNVSVHHAALSGALKEQTEQSFTNNRSAFIISTSTLELGLDIGNLDFVLQYGPPSSVSSFMQRLGRSGRRNTPARMGFLLSDKEGTALTVAAIMATSMGRVEPLFIPRYPFDLLVREILLMVLSGMKVSTSTVILMKDSNRYSSITEFEICSLLDHLIESGYLVDSGLLLMAGPALDMVNRSGLYTLIQSENTRDVVTRDGEIVGKVSSMQAGNIPFTLGGQSWAPDGNEPDIVSSSPLSVGRYLGHAGAPLFRGKSPEKSRLLLYSLAELIMRLHNGTMPVPVPEGTLSILNEYASEFPSCISPEKICIVREKSRVFVYTFFGLSYNKILGGSLQYEGCKCTGADDIVMVFSGKNVDENIISEKINEILLCSWEDIIPDKKITEREIPMADLLPKFCLLKLWYLDNLHLDLMIEDMKKKTICIC